MTVTKYIPKHTKGTCKIINNITFKIVTWNFRHLGNFLSVNEEEILSCDTGLFEYKPAKMLFIVI